MENNLLIICFCTSNYCIFLLTALGGISASFLTLSFFKNHVIILDNKSRLKLHFVPSKMLSKATPAKDHQDPKSMKVMISVLILQIK